MILSPIHVLKVNIKLAIVDILVPSICLYLLRDNSIEIQHIGTFTDSGEQDICDIDGCSVNMVIMLFSCRHVDREKDQMVEDKE